MSSELKILFLNVKNLTSVTAYILLHFFSIKNSFKATSLNVNSLTFKTDDAYSIKWTKLHIPDSSHYFHFLPVPVSKTWLHIFRTMYIIFTAIQNFDLFLDSFWEIYAWSKSKRVMLIYFCKNIIISEIKCKSITFFIWMHHIILRTFT